MSEYTKIEWCDATLNPLVGCSHKPISAGCENCYAVRMAVRIPKYRHLVEYGKWTGQTIYQPWEFNKALRWKKGKRIFLCSMGDPFIDNGRWLNDRMSFTLVGDFLGELTPIEAMCKLNQHTFFLLTKRPDKIPDIITFPNNVWLGVTVENPDSLWRLGDLERLEKDAHIRNRFISFEPLLSEIPDYKVALHKCVDWIIVGAESGPRRRPCKLDWVRRIVRYGRDVRIPVFVKQLDIDGKLSHDPSEWPEDLRVRQRHDWAGRDCSKLFVTSLISYSQRRGESHETL